MSKSLQIRLKDWHVELIKNQYNTETKQVDFITANIRNFN